MKYVYGPMKGKVVTGNSKYGFTKGKMVLDQSVQMNRFVSAVQVSFTPT